jgi:hypothetical protein
VDTAHAFVDVTTARESLYVMASRGCESNRLYVDTASQPGTEVSSPEPELTASEVLQSVIADSAAEQSATDTMAERWAQAHSAGQLSAEYQAVAADETASSSDPMRQRERARALAERAKLLRRGTRSQRTVVRPQPVHAGPTPSL